MSGSAPESRQGQPLRRGERTNPEGKPVGNAILLSISSSEFDVIRPHLDYVSLPQRTSLYEANRKLEAAYVLNSGMISLVCTTRTGESVEVGVVGGEGSTPTPMAAGFTGSTHRSGVLSGG